MELFWNKVAQIQGNMSSSLSIGFEIADTACEMPAMQIHYQPFNSHVFSNSRPAAFSARFDRVDDTDFFLSRKVLNTLVIRFILRFPGLFP